MADADQQELRQCASSDGTPGPYFHGKGYRRLGQNGDPQCPPPQYTPAPTTFPPPPQPQQTSFSNNSSNVVVVGQPSPAQPETVIVDRSRPNDNLMVTLCLMVLCCVTLNFTAFLCLVPALILSLSAGCASNSGDYDAARGYARMSCCCSLCSLAVYIMAIITGLIVLVLFLTVGLGFIGIEAQADV